MKVSLVIPYWNGEEKIRKHLPDVLRVARKSGIEEVIACDDASSDKTVDLLKKEFPDVVLVERKINGGFSSNVNDGFRRASGDLVVLLNSDATPEDDFLKYALPHFNNPKVFSVGCSVGEGLWSTGKFENGYFWHGQGKLVDGKKLEAHQTLWASGGSSIFRKDLWEEMGGLDELFNPFYEEDVDLGYRATKRGYINIWEPKSKVEHYKEKGVIETHFSKAKVSGTAQRNQLIFIWKNITSNTLLSDHKKVLAKMLLNHPKYWKVFLSALSKWPQIISKRKIEQKATKLSDEDVFSIFT